MDLNFCIEYHLTVMYKPQKRSNSVVIIITLVRPVLISKSFDTRIFYRLLTYPLRSIMHGKVQNIFCYEIYES